MKLQILPIYFLLFFGLYPLSCLTNPAPNWTKLGATSSFCVTIFTQIYSKFDIINLYMISGPIFVCLDLMMHLVLLRSLSDFVQYSF